jgi:hypothetical protein
MFIRTNGVWRCGFGLIGGDTERLQVGACAIVGAWARRPSIRKRSAGMRVLSETMNDVEARATMLRLADDYDYMAD